ncbi:MAG: hypothetical protein F8N37_24855 [Telmatospirillum sp.]|nr:hypothetical protein [Telmatospirillum sp.]
MAFKTDIVIGDRFTKVGSFQMPTWTVSRITHTDDKPPHAHLAKEGSPNDWITVGLMALTDQNLYRRLPTPTGAEGAVDSRH